MEPKKYIEDRISRTEKDIRNALILINDQRDQENYLIAGNIAMAVGLFKIARNCFTKQTNELIYNKEVYGNEETYDRKVREKEISQHNLNNLLKMVSPGKLTSSGLVNRLIKTRAIRDKDGKIMKDENRQIIKEKYLAPEDARESFNEISTNKTPENITNYIKKIKNNYELIHSKSQIYN